MSAKKKSGNGEWKIVIVEDSATQAEQLKYILEANGYKVAVASNGREALTLVRSDRPDIVISDIVMPEMDGYELCKQIKTDDKLKDIPIMLLTALSDPVDVIRGLGCGADNFVTKPYDERGLLSRIEYLQLNRGLQETESVRIGLEITFGGQKYSITSDRLQILNLLLSTYESAVNKNRELEQAHTELRRLNEQLEQRVKARTAELAKANEELKAEITERKQAEERIIHLNSVLRAIRGVNQLITLEKDRKRLIQQSCSLMVKTRGFLCAWILLFDEKRKYLSAAVTGGKEIQGFYKQLEQGNYPPCIDRILAHKDSFAVCGDIVENGLDCLPRSLYSGSSGLISRLEYEGKVYGIASVYIQSEYALDPEEQSLFRELAGDIAFALYNIEKEEKRKQAEEALRESEERFRTILDSASDGILLADLETKRFYITNRAICQMLGYSLEEIRNLGVTDIHPEKDLPYVLEQFEKQSRGEITLSGDIPIKRKDGSVFYADVNTSVLTFGRKTYIAGIFRDTTERKKMEETLRENEAKWRSLVENAPNIVMLIDRDRKIQFINHVVAGIDAKDVIGRSVYDYIQPEHHDVAEKTIDRVFKTGEPAYYEIKGVGPDGRISWYETRVGAIKSGVEVAGVIQISSDVTERRQNEEALQKSEASLAEAQRIAHVGSWDWDILKNELSYSDEFYHVFGRRVQNFAMFLDSVHPDDREFVEKSVNGALRGDKPYDIEYRIILPNDEERVIHAQGEVTLENTGKPIRMVGTVQDITEHKKMEEQLILTDRLASIGELASGIAHELNNPLTGVIGLSQLLAQRDVPKDIKEDLNLVYSEAQRAANVVKNLLTFARKHPSAKQPLNINEVIGKVLEIRAYEDRVSNIEVVTHLASDLSQIMADYFQLQQVFLNIVINAEHFMIEAHNKGTLTITTQKVGGIVQASFADDGPGISKENLGHIFDPFFTTKEVGKGTGLGLSICHGIVAAHGGQIYAESELGKGATFIVELPLSQEEQ